jgi:diguanylate cyclase (GGDEF)-like protein/PAS domain S-box-containing protein
LVKCSPTCQQTVAGLAAASLDLSASVESLLRVVIDQIDEVFDDRATIGLPGFDDSDMPVVASSLPDTIEAAIDQIRTSHSLTDGVILWSAHEPQGAWLADHRLGQCAMLPVGAAGRVLGTLAVARTAGRAAFSPDELALLTAIAQVTAVLAVQRRTLGDAMVALEELRHQVELADTISDALIACDAAGQIVNWNAAAERVYGYPASEALGCDLFTLLATEFSDIDDSVVERDEVTRTVVSQGRWQGELRERGADGAPLVVLSSVTVIRNRAGLVDGFVVVNRDVTEHRQERHRAMHDPLTSLPNRRMLDRCLFDAFARASRSGRTLGVLFIDLNGFKPINDTFGHAAGDEVLCAVAQRLIAVLRSRDTAGRLGGDEFLVILEDAGNATTVEAIASRVAGALDEPITLADGRSVTATASIGVAFTEHPDELRTSAQAILEAADHAMYTAKRRHSRICLAPLPPGPGEPPSEADRAQL